MAILLAITGWSFIARARRGAGPDAGSGLAVPDGHRRAWLGVLGVTALIFVAGGPVALAVPVLAYLAGRPRSPGRPRAWLPWVAFAGMVTSGLLSAARPFGAGLLGPFGGPAQACALIALAAALTPAVSVPSGRLRPLPEAPAEAAPATTEGETDR